jgi:putative solute:sodium symporter small subunit
MAVEGREHLEPAGGRHEIQTVILAVATISIVLFAVIGVIATFSWFNRFAFLHFPLGFYLLAQGLLIFIVVMAFWFIRMQERIDEARAQSEEWVGR